MLPEEIKQRNNGQTEEILTASRVPVSGIGGDQQAAPLGKCIKPGMVKNTYITGWFYADITGTNWCLEQKQLLLFCQLLYGKLMDAKCNLCVGRWRFYWRGARQWPLWDGLGNN